MQTFLPVADFTATAQMLDKKRLWKQVLEAKTILSILQGTAKEKVKRDGTTYIPWSQHPAVLMWQGYESALEAYYSELLSEAKYRRGINTQLTLLQTHIHVVLPPWLGHSAFHASHRSNLLRKDWAYYSQFQWAEVTDIPYLWPVLKSIPAPEYYTCYTRPDPLQQIWILKSEQECVA